MVRLSRLLSFSLALIIVLTSQQLALARGQSMATGEMVLCIGGGFVTVPVDAKGQPVGPAHICPDGVMAFAGTDVPQTLANWVPVVHRADLPVRLPQLAIVATVTVPMARAPPDLT